MKGVIISFAALAVFVLGSSIAARILRLRRDLQVFGWMLPVGIVAYFVLFALTPANLGFLPEGWLCSNRTLDVWYGFIVLILNCHTFVDCISASCAGFSVSLLIILEKSAPTDEIVNKFRVGQQGDSIYAWRLPHLEKRGYIRKEGNGYALTGKGRIVAVITYSLKRLMNLGAGG